MTPEFSSAAGHGENGVLPSVLDGNAAAGEFAGVFASDATAVTVRCGGCGATQPFAALRAYMGGPGTVLRCRRCEAMVARVARTPLGTWLDISGSSSWLFPTTAESA